MTKDELIALRRERGKQELNIGDRVKVYDQNGNVMYGGKVAIIIEKALLDPTEFYYGIYVEGETVDKFRDKGLLYLKNAATKIGKTALLAPFFAEDLELMKQPTDEIKCGDIVRVKRETPSDLYNNLLYDMPFFVAEIERDCDNPMYDTFLLRNGKTCLNIHPHWLEKWDVKPQHTDNTITIPVKADLDDTYWDAYRAELAKEIAVKLGDNNTITNPKVCDFITDFATRIVDNLKKQSE